ncbi:hypothetical protein Tco_1332590, partial [Tanacetum coccineum]
GSRDPVKDCITTTITYILTTTIITTYHTSMQQSIYGSDESCHIVHQHPSTSIEDTTIRDTTIRDTTNLTHTITYIIITSTDRRADVSEAVLPPRKRLYIALGPRFEVRECSSVAARPTRGFRADYGFVGTMDAEIRRDPDREDTYEIYVRLDDAQSDRSLMTGQLNVLRRDRRYHANTALLVEREARVAREAWAQSMDASHRARSEVMTLRTMVSALQTENGELRAADHRRQTQLLETLTQVRALQTQIVVLQRQRIEDSDRLTQHIQHEHDRFREFQRTRDVAPEDADSSS